MERTTQRNYFVEELKKNLRQKVVVTIHTPTGIVNQSGVCMAIDFKSKSVILSTDSDKILIPHFLFMKRERTHGRH